MIENRGELIKELRKINDKISKLRNRGYDSKLVKEYYSEKYDKERELRKIKKPIYEKYFFEYPIKNGRWLKNLKPPIKQGIKVGLGVKYLNLIYEEDILRVARILIKEDLEKTDEKIINLEIKKIDEKLNKIYKQIDRKTEILKKREKEISYKLNKKDIDKNQEKIKKKDYIKMRINGQSPELMKKIRGEVNKRLVMDKLK